MDTEFYWCLFLCLLRLSYGFSLLFIWWIAFLCFSMYLIYYLASIFPLLKKILKEHRKTCNKIFLFSPTWSPSIMPKVTIVISFYYLSNFFMLSKQRQLYILILSLCYLISGLLSSLFCILFYYLVIFLY